MGVMLPSQKLQRHERRREMNDAAKPNARDSGESRLAEEVTQAVQTYFRDLDGHAPSDLFALVMGEVERPLLAAVLTHTDGNLTRAAQYLGLNRTTLRNKLRKYGLIP